jgi:hypothetical protein
VNRVLHRSAEVVTFYDPDTGLLSYGVRRPGSTYRNSALRSTMSAFKCDRTRARFILHRLRKEAQRQGSQ